MEGLEEASQPKSGFVSDWALNPLPHWRKWQKKGRHDPCIGPRALSVIEAMIASLTLDHILLARLDK